MPICGKNKITIQLELLIWREKIAHDAMGNDKVNNVFIVLIKVLFTVSYDRKKVKWCLWTMSLLWLLKLKSIIIFLFWTFRDGIPFFHFNLWQLPSSLQELIAWAKQMKQFITNFINVKSKSNIEDNGQVWKVYVCACAFFVWRAKFETIKIIAKNFWVQMNIFIWWEISVGILRQMMGRRDNWKQCAIGRVLQFVCYIRLRQIAKITLSM